jgi:hypothetical protein
MPMEIRQKIREKQMAVNIFTKKRTTMKREYELQMVNSSRPSKLFAFHLIGSAKVHLDNKTFF